MGALPGPPILVREQALLPSSTAGLVESGYSPAVTEESSGGFKVTGVFLSLLGNQGGSHIGKSQGTGGDPATAAVGPG